jgi:hypothetical protein
MKILTNKQKTTTACKGSLRCKLEIQGKMVEKMMSFKYLGLEVTNNGALH